jgi:DNA-binding cell septation regulator SpoVG
MYKLCLSFAFLAFFAGYLFCQNLYVSKISKDGAFYNIALNGALEVYGVRLVDVGGKTDIIFPVYKGKHKDYKQFYITDRTFKNRLTASLKNNSINTDTAPITFKINKFNKAHSNSVKIFASVIFNNSFETECKIISSPHGLWIAWPALKENGTWQKKFEITDKALKNEIENALLEKYKNETNIA